MKLRLKGGPADGKTIDRLYGDPDSAIEFYSPDTGLFRYVKTGEIKNGLPVWAYDSTA
jgi:hypothetical protein